MAYSALPTFRLERDHCALAEPPTVRAAVELDSPATAVLTDLTVLRAATIGSHSSLHLAERAMIRNSVRLLFVVDDPPLVAGVITAADVAGHAPLRLLAERGGQRADLTVADVMTPLGALDALDYGQLQRATVGDVVATLLRFGRSHLVIVDHPGSACRVRGLVSITQVERQLSQSLPSVEVAATFAEIEAALA